MSVVDVVVIGGGVLGCAIAARVSSTTASVCLLEATGDVGEGASKGNAGIAVSYYGAPAHLDTRLIRESNGRWEDVCGRLDVPYRRIGGLMIALDATEAATLDHVVDEARAGGARAELLDGAAARRIEPLVTESRVAAVHLPDEGVIDPMRLTVGYARLAAANGCDVRRESPVIAIREVGDGVEVVTPAGAVRARHVVDAAGVHAGEVSRLAGGEEHAMWPRKGQYLVLDREFGRRLRSIVFCTHSADTKGTNVVPTTHGTCLLGPTSTDHEDEGDRSTDAATLEEIRAAAIRLVPATRDAAAIKSFAANRPASDERTRIHRDAARPWLVHATNRSTGVSTSPAAADLALALLHDAGLDACERPDAVRSLRPTPRLRTAARPERLIDVDARYGQVVCACEQVTAAEIAAALEGPVGARSVDGVRKRTGATYGRCQGALCMAGVTFLTAMATGAGPGTARHTAGGTVGA